MDLGISGKTAIVCGASKGLGKACADALAHEGVDVVIAARTEVELLEAEADINTSGGGTATAVVADVTTEEGRDKLFAACPEPDIVINNAGGPPPGDFRDWDQQDWFDAINANMYSAIDMIRRCLDGMIDREFGRVLNITSNSVKQPIPGLGLSGGARAGLTGFVAGIAHEPARYNVTINNVLPGQFATDRLKGLLAKRAEAEGTDPDVYYANHCENMSPGRAGHPDEFGAVCAFLCSQQAAYITAQNILVDGGVYRGTL